jgi:hypothetical protein
VRYLLATARSGSTNLQLYLSKLLPLEQIKKILIHRVPDEYYNDMFDYGDKLLTQYPNSFILDRKDKVAQSESLAFRKMKYEDDFSKYHIREFYNDFDDEYMKGCLYNFTKQSDVLKKLSQKHNKQILYYEDIFQSNAPDVLLESNMYNESLYNMYLHSKGKSRLIEPPTKKLI